MIGTSARLLALLGLLQSRPTWTRPRSGRRAWASTERTLRKDIERLRDLGYPVDASAAGPAATGSAARAGCRPCSSTTTRPSPSRSG